MNRQVFGVAWYRFRTTFHSRRGGYLALALLIGLMGGLAMGAVAAARRTQSSFPAFLASTRPSDLTTNAFSNSGGYDPQTLATVNQLPHVRRSESQVDLAVGPLLPNGAPDPAAASGLVVALGSVDGLGFRQDRVVVTQGRMADPKRADEVVMTKDAAHLLGLHLGQVVRLGAYTDEQITEQGFGTAQVAPHARTSVRLVGIVVFNNGVIQDDVARTPTYALFTRAFTRKYLRCCAYGTETGLQLDQPGNVAAVESTIERSLPAGAAYYFQVTSTVEAQAERAIKPEAIALGVFGAIAAFAALIIAGQLIGRQVRRGADEGFIVRALGAGPVMTSTDGLIGTLGALVIGSVLAAAVAVGVSPFAPLGPARAVNPTPGINFDWAVLGLGIALLVVGLGAVAVMLAVRNAPHRVARRPDRAVPRRSTLARAAATSGLPAPAVAGIRFALEPGVSRNTVPVRSAILGAALAIIVITSTLTFGASLNSLVSHPALYGWNWTYELNSQAGGGNIPAVQAKKLLDNDHDVVAWTGVYFDSLRLDGQTVPIIGGTPRAALGPPLLSGHALNASDQIVLGATTLAQLHKRLGDTVGASYGTSKPVRLHIVGTATMPAVGPGSGLHLSIGTGAVVSYRLIPPSVRNGDAGDAFLPNAIFVRLRNGANRAASVHALQRILNTVSSIDVPGSYGAADGTVVSVQRPAEIVNYRSMGATPMLLATALAAGTVAALGLTLIASVRRRRRDLAILKTLGFTRWQLAEVVAWQSSVAVSIGTVVGIPIGIVIGRFLWQSFAHAIDVVPQAAIPATTIVLIGIGALVLANLVAAVPARQASHTPTALLLRAE